MLKRMKQKIVSVYVGFVPARFKNILLIFALLVLIFYSGNLILKRQQDLSSLKFFQVRLDLYEISEALEKYKKNNGSYPYDAEGLSVLFQSELLSWPEGGYFRGLQKEIKDPWGNRYFFKKIQRIPYIIKSTGPDGISSSDDIFFFHTEEEIESIQARVNNLRDELGESYLPLIISTGLVILLLLKLFWDLLKTRKMT